MAEPTHAELREAIMLRIIPILRRELDSLDLTQVECLSVKFDQIVNLEELDVFIETPFVNGFDPGEN